MSKLKKVKNQISLIKIKLIELDEIISTYTDKDYINESIKFKAKMIKYLERFEANKVILESK